MGRLQIHINDGIEKRFRIYLAKKGFKKGDISREIENMIKEKIDERRKK